MDFSDLLLGALLLVAGIAVGVLIGRAHPRDRRDAGHLDALLAPASDAMRRVEEQLQGVVELAGMVEHCDFDTQVGVRSTDPEAAGVRPDMIIRLSGGRQIPVDAKVPFASYLEAAECPDERRRTALLPAPEFVVLFVPGDPLLDAALSVDAGLTDHAFARNVVIATPSTLIALLR